MKYVLKHVEAFQIGMGDYIPLWVSHFLNNSEDGFKVTTHEGEIDAKRGDYIIKKSPETVDVISKEMFEHLYEKYYASNVKLGSSQLC